MTSWLCAGIVAVFCGSIANAQINYSNSLAGAILIYSNAFNGAAVNITNTQANYEAGVFGGGSNTNWLDVLGPLDTNAYYANGTVGTPQGDSIILPLAAQSNHVYTLIASVNISGYPGSWIGAGFANFFGNNTSGRLSTGGINWAILTANGNENIQWFENSTQIGNVNHAYSLTGLQTMKLVLDSTANKWTIACFINGTQISTNYSFASTPTIGCVGLTQNTLTAGLESDFQWTALQLFASQLELLQQPTSTNVNSGSAFTNTVVVGGTPPFSYQWYNNGTPIANATNASLIINPVSASNASTNYYVIVTNSAYGAVTSSPAILTVSTSPTFLEQYPVPYVSVFTNYAGANPQFSVVAAGAQPITYQWYTNGVAVGGQTSSSFTWTNVQIGIISNYCVAANSIGSSTSMVWTASVIADPTAPYPQKVLSLNPIGYWRLNEVNPNESEGGDDGFIAYDYINGNDGIYSNVVLSYSTGYSPGTDPGDTAPLFGILSGSDSDAFAIQGINLGTPTNSATFSVEAWVNGGGFSQVNGAGIVSQGSDGSESFALDLTNNDYQFLIHDAAGNLYTATAAFGPNGNWHHVVGVCDEVNGKVSLYVDGQVASTVPIAPGSGLLSSTNSMVIGSRSQSPISGNNMQFSGYLNDVALFNYALSVGQIAEQYSMAQTLTPYFSQAPPASETVNAGSSLTIPATVIGSMPLGYTWTDVRTGTTVAAAVTNNNLPLNATLNVVSVPTTWNGDQLELTVTNSVGTLNAYVALTVFTNATIIQDLPPQITLLSGASYTYSIGVGGVPPYSYQWYQAGTALANQTNSTYIATAGAPGSTTYYVVITNTYGAVTSTVSTFISASQPTNAYAAGISQLNPVGYWPMHEVESPAPGDIETNYGTLGILGAAYYPDWTGNYVSFTRQVQGALVNDTDTALHFNYNVGALGNGVGTWTNEIYIPHTSPLATLNPPFSVECWLLNTNGSVGGSALNQSIWGQFGWEGLNAGPAGGGSGSIRGMQLAYDNDGSIAIYCYTNGTGDTVVTSDGSATTNIWHHVVVTCDANTNFTLYVDGTTPGAVAGVGKYNPDYWTPLCIGGTRGGTRSAIVTVDEFAVYTNALSSSVITTHYNDGISGAAGAYFHDVTNNGAVIYLRMDAPSYTPPQLGSWPELINYGTAGNAGVYTPGTAPGAVTAGPALNGTNYVGLSGSTNVAALSGVSSFADAGYASAYNPTGSNANFTVAAMFRGNPCDNRVQAIVSHGNNSWQLNVNTTGNIVFNAGNGNTSTSGTGQNPGDVTSTGVYNDGNWHQVVAVNSTNRVSLYVDGVLDTSTTPSGITPTNTIPGNFGDVMIGADPSNTNNPVGVGRQFAGQVCEVAFFNQAMTAAQVQHLYSLALAGNTVVINPNPTNILFAVTNNQLSLSWPADHIGWQLQAQTNNLSVGISNDWVNVSGSTTTNVVLVPVNITNGSVFYRLIYTP